jgi:histidinol-phosphate/aromatic aminotransferase/cobyric acid decarboxylase-like protein
VRCAAGVVLIDEAYADFSEDDVIALALASDRALVLRTLSKAWGMAGLRIGFAIGPAELIREVEKSRGPYKVGALAEAAAVAALERDAAWMRAGVDQVRRNRDRLAEALDRIGTPPLPSAANFLLVPLPARLGTATDAGARLRAGGVAVRPFRALPSIGEAIRVTIGPWPMLESFLAAFTRLLEAPDQPPAPRPLAESAATPHAHGSTRGDR